MASLAARAVKDPPAVREAQVQLLSWEDALEMGTAVHSGLLPGESHGQRSLVGHSPWGHKESDTTERLLWVHMCV